MDSENSDTKFLSTITQDITRIPRIPQHINMETLLIIWMCWFGYVTSVFLCGDNSQCMCFPDQRLIDCGSAKAPEYIEFHPSTSMQYDKIIVPNSFTCKDISQVFLTSGIPAFNARKCSEDIKPKEERTVKDRKHRYVPANEDMSRKMSDKTWKSDNIVSSTSKEYSGFDISYKVINILIVVLMSVVGLKLHYNMRPFIRLLPKPYANMAGFMSYITRRKTNIPDISKHFSMTFESVDEVYDEGQNFPNTQMQSSMSQKDSNMSTNAQSSSAVDSDDKIRGIELKTPMQFSLSSPLMSSTKLSDGNSKKQTPPPFPLRGKKKTDIIDATPLRPVLPKKKPDAVGAISPNDGAIPGTSGDNPSVP